MLEEDPRVAAPVAAMPPPPIALPVVLRSLAPLLDARALAAALAVSSIAWGDRAHVAATAPAIVAALSLDGWKRLAASLGAARLLRVLRALRDAVGYAGLQELNKAPLARGMPGHVSATLWLMSL